MFNENIHNTIVEPTRTVRELFDKCEKLRGLDGRRHTKVTIGLLRQLADLLLEDFEQADSGFVRRRKT